MSRYVNKTFDRVNALYKTPPASGNAGSQGWCSTDRHPSQGIIG